MIRHLLHSSKHTFGKVLYYPKYGCSHYDALEYARILSSAKPDPNEKYNVEDQPWTKPPYNILIRPSTFGRGGSEINPNNSKVKPE